MFELTVKGEFSAAHRLRGYEGACERLHGHNWKVEIRLASEVLNDQGLAIDFRLAKALLNEVLEGLDHRFLNDLEPFLEELTARLPGGVELTEVTAWETPGCAATYRP